MEPRITTEDFEATYCSSTTEDERRLLALAANYLAAKDWVAAGMIERDIAAMGRMAHQRRAEERAAKRDGLERTWWGAWQRAAVKGA